MDNGDSISAISIAPYPLVGADNLVDVVRSLDELVLKPELRSRAASIAYDRFGSAVERDGNSNAGSIEAPAEGSVLERKEMRLIEALQDLRKLLVAERGSLAASNFHVFYADIVNCAIACNCDLCRMGMSLSMGLVIV